ncbi:MAG: LacI family DNA-binding transcriptional regulator [Bryobacteraceae bacterium]
MIRMKDVAERCGVSETTVSHVVNGTRYVTPETRRRVQEAIRDLGFYTNAHARRLARGSSDFLGLVISDIENPFFPEMIKTFEAAALKRGFDVLLCTTNYDSERTRAAMRKMIENKVPGVAIMTSQVGAEVTQDLATHHVASVFLNSPPIQMFRSNIAIDYAKGAGEAIRHLHELGHRRFAFIQGPQHRPSAVMARQAVLDAVAAYSHPCAVHQGENTIESGAETVRRLLAAGELPTALLCDNDLGAIGALSALKDARIGVPERISVVGADDIPFAHLSSPPLTTIRVPRDLVGELAFEALDKMLRSKRHSGVEYHAETSLVVRQSTGPVRSAPMPAAREKSEIR